MSGTREGGLKASATIKATHGPDFYREIGRKGGKVSTGGGFAVNPALARVAGAKGGRIGRRGYEYLGEADGKMVYIRKSNGEVAEFDKNDEKGGLIWQKEQ